MHSCAQVGRPEQTGQDTAEDVAEPVRRIDRLDGLVLSWRPLRQQPDELGVLARDQGVSHVRDVAICERCSAVLLMQIADCTFRIIQRLTEYISGTML
jgi:hypothetical protein